MSTTNLISTVRNIHLPDFVKRVEVSQPPSELRFGLMYKCDLPAVLDEVLRMASAEVLAATGIAVTLKWVQDYDRVTNPLSEIGKLVITAPEKQWRSGPIQVQDIMFKWWVRVTMPLRMWWLNRRAK